MRPWLCLFVVVACGAGCDDREAIRRGELDGGSAKDGSAPDVADDDAGAEDAGVPEGLREAIVALLTQYDRETKVRCPCQVATGDFASMEECIDAFGDGLGWADCLTHALAHDDSAELREQIQCHTDQNDERTTCLESSTCAAKDVAECSKERVVCPLYDPQLFTRVLNACPDTILLH